MATETLGSAIVKVSAPLDKLREDLGLAQKEVAKSSGGFAKSASTVGRSMTRTVTPAAAGFAAASKLAFNEWDAGIDAIRTGTGKTGEELDALGDSMEKVAGRVAIPMADVGQIVADLNTALGLTGEPLEDLTQQIAELQEIGANISTDTVTRLMGDWSVAAEDMTGTMDELFRVSQTTGIPMDQLAGTMTDFGAPLRQLGFGFEQSAVLLGKWEKEGVNTEAVLAGMKIGLGKMAKAGEAPDETFNRLIDQMANVATDGEAMAIAVEAFGTRAGPDMAAAVREGRFELEDLQAQIDGNTDTIHAAAEGTRSMSDKFLMLKNRVIGVVGPYGEFGMVLGGVVAGVGPMLQGIGALAGPGGALAKIGPMVATAMPWLLAIGAALLIGHLVITHWDTIKEALASAFNWLIDAGGKVWRFFELMWQGIANFGIAAFEGVVNFIIGILNWLLDQVDFMLGPFVNFGSIPTLQLGRVGASEQTGGKTGQLGVAHTGGNVLTDGVLSVQAGETILPAGFQGFNGSDVAAPASGDVYLDGQKVGRILRNGLLEDGTRLGGVALG